MPDVRKIVPTGAMKALEAHREAERTLSRKVEETERLYENRIRPFVFQQTSERQKESAAEAADLIRWVNEIESAGFRTRVMGTLSECDVPVARARVDIAVDKRRITLKGELLIRVHAEGCSIGMYRYAEWCDDVAINRVKRNNNITCAEDLSRRIPPELLRQLHRKIIIEKQAWNTILPWIKSRSSQQLRASRGGG